MIFCILHWDTFFRDHVLHLVLNLFSTTVLTEGKVLKEFLTHLNGMEFSLLQLMDQKSTMMSFNSSSRNGSFMENGTFSDTSSVKSSRASSELSSEVSSVLSDTSSSQSISYDTSAALSLSAIIQKEKF